MSEELNKHNTEHMELEEAPARRDMSRRQFLSYTLGGTGAFLVGLPLIFNLRFAVDPLLQRKAEADWVRVVEEDKLTFEPQQIDFQVHQIDGWYESNPIMKVWISRDEQGILALSPVCKHLGCTIDWNTQERFPNQYFCPCHDARYDRNGRNLAVAPEPLDQYDVKVENGWVYLGQLRRNQRV